MGFDIETAFDSRDWAAVNAAAHKLKGTAGSFGFGEISKISGLIEKSVAADVDVKDIPEDLAMYLSKLKNCVS